MDGKVILRTGRRIPGVRPLGGVHAPIAVVRMAADDAYNAREWREARDGEEWAYRTDKISRATCRVVAEFAFQYARKVGAKVFGGPKFTVSPVYEGLFKEELDAAHGRHPHVRYEPQLIDATLALLLATSGEALVIPTLNRDGDLLPMAMILAGAALLSYVGSPEADRASRAIYEAVFEAVFDGTKTPDLGGHATTTDLTDEVIRRVKSKLEVWSTLG